MEFVAEIGWNFLGDLSLAEEMIAAASNANATFAKFQVWDPANLKTGPWDRDGRREIYQKARLDIEKLEKLYVMCGSHKIKFLASVFEQKSLKILSKIDKDYVKIPSHECNNWELIEEARETFNNVFLSVGAISNNDLDELLRRFGGDQNIVVMHCVSTYPLEPSHVNLPKLNRLKKQCKRTGYSSHYTGLEDTIAATAMGVELIEKHFTTNRDLPGRDNKFALLPHEFKQMVNGCKIVEKMLHDRGDDIQDVELDVAHIMRGRWNAQA